MAEIRDIAPGLWVWSRAHPDWTPESDFEGPVTSTCVATGGEVVIRRTAPHFTAEELFEGKSAAEWRREYADAHDWGADIGREAVEE